jgi:hypothetical protein
VELEERARVAQQLEEEKKQLEEKTTNLVDNLMVRRRDKGGREVEGGRGRGGREGGREGGERREGREGEDEDGYCHGLQVKPPCEIEAYKCLPLPADS